jgi:hypothetical protein
MAPLGFACEKDDRKHAMKILRILLRLLGALGVLLLTLFTLAVSGVNWTSVTQYWVLIAGGGCCLLLLTALLSGGLAYMAKKQLPRKAVKKQIIVACVFLVQLPLHFLFNGAFSWSARMYVEHKLPQLEAYRQSKGCYPGSLDEVVTGGKVTSFLMSQWSSYSVFNERSSYRISVYRPMAAGHYAYDPVSKSWETRK